MSDDTPAESPLETAIRIAGGQKKLADSISAFRGEPLTQQAVSYWLKHRTPIEAKYWPAIESITEQQVTRRHLRPDIFPQSEVA